MADSLLMRSSESTSPEVLWSLLNPEERNKFLKAFQNPTSDLAQKLLSSDILGAKVQQPWWMYNVIAEEASELPKMPHIMPIPPSLVRSRPTNQPLVFNVVAIWSVKFYVAI